MRLAATALEGAPPSDPTDLPFGAAGLVGGTAVVVAVGPRSARSLGPALLWSRRRGASHVRLVTDSPATAGVLARRAPLLGERLDVWQWTPDGPAEAVATPPSPVRVPNAEHLALVPRIVDGGADVVVEHGVVSGEVLGLEVCRVVEEDGSPRLAVGVGAHDRETQRLVHGDDPGSLRRVVEDVLRVRISGTPHPLARLAPERLLRHRLMVSPSLVGCSSIDAAEPPVVRESLLDDAPCAALGDGGDTVIVCGGFADPDVVSWALDARLRLASGARLVVVAAEGNTPSAVRDLASRVMGGVGFVELPRT